MNPIAMSTDDVRLYSKQQRVPVDVVAPEHLDLHSELERWGQWNREGRPGPGSCASLEGDFTGSGGRETRTPVVSLPPDPRLARIEAAVVSMIRDRVAEQYGETLREFYCKRWEPKTVCWAHALQYEGFARWMYLCRQAVGALLEA